MSALSLLLCWVRGLRGHTSPQEESGQEAKEKPHVAEGHLPTGAWEPGIQGSEGPTHSSSLEGLLISFTRGLHLCLPRLTKIPQGRKVEEGGEGGMGVATQ